MHSAMQLLESGDDEPQAVCELLCQWDGEIGGDRRAAAGAARRELLGRPVTSLNPNAPGA
jgi:hypothetical protein